MQAEGAGFDEGGLDMELVHGFSLLPNNSPWGQDSSIEIKQLQEECGLVGCFTGSKIELYLSLWMMGFESEEGYTSTSLSTSLGKLPYNWGDMNAETADRLANEKIIWMATVRPDGRPHLVPIWFVTYEDAVFICMQEGSVKARNLAHNPRIALSLQDGMYPLIAEGTVTVVQRPYPDALAALFQNKYEWDIVDNEEYRHLVQVRVGKWLNWKA